MKIPPPAFANRATVEAPKLKPTIISQISGVVAAGKTASHNRSISARPVKAIPAMQRPMNEPALNATLKAGISPPFAAAAAVRLFALVATIIPR